jgi:hypothetical protein
VKQIHKRLTYANVMSSIAVFLVLGGGAAIAAGGLGKNTVGSKQLKKNAVTAVKVKDGSLLGADFAPGQLPAGEKGPVGATGPAGPATNNSVTSASVLDDTAPGGGLNSQDLAANSVTASEIAADVVGSSEIASNVVGADELDTVHEHTGPATNVVDGTAHDGIYAPSTSTVECGIGEDLLSVSVDWTDLGGHNEVVTSGVDSITRGEPDSATVRVAYDGGAGPATYVAVATCIF